MAWSPRTWTTGETVTSALLNTELRDLMLETSPATATTAGDLIYADAANSMGSRLAHPGAGSRILVSSATNALAWRLPAEDIDYGDASTSQVDSTTTYTSSWGAVPQTLPAVTVTTGVLALVIVSCFRVINDTAGGKTLIAFSVSGATTHLVGDGHAALVEASAANDDHHVAAVRLIGLNAGSNTFTMQARVTTGLGTIERPRIAVIPF